MIVAKRKTSVTKKLSEF